MQDIKMTENTNIELSQETKEFLEELRLEQQEQM